MYTMTRLLQFAKQSHIHWHRSPHCNLSTVCASLTPRCVLIRPHLRVTAADAGQVTSLRWILRHECITTRILHRSLLSDTDEGRCFLIAGEYKVCIYTARVERVVVVDPLHVRRLRHRGVLGSAYNTPWAVKTCHFIFHYNSRTFR